MSLHKRNKYERIQYVRSLGFNTEDSILVKPGDNLKQYQKFIKKLDKISLRTFNQKDDLYAPHFPILTKEEANIKIPELLKQDINCIVATPIDPKDCKYAGCAMKSLEQMTVELADGPGTVRRVTHEGKVDRSYSINLFLRRLTDNPELNYILKQFVDCYVEECIFEFSMYNIPVGIYKQNAIVWEITDAGFNKSGV